MSRKPNGPPEAVERALKTAKTTQSALELRRILAVVLPVLHGISLKESATLIGRSETWVAKERQKYINERNSQSEVRAKGGRRNQLIPVHEEDLFMDLVCQQYIHSHTEWRTTSVPNKALHEKVSKSFVEFAHAALELRIQRKTTRTTVYNLLARTGKRRFALYVPYAWKRVCEDEIYESVRRIRRATT